jgi:hypothetical protein
MKEAIAKGITSGLAVNPSRRGFFRFPVQPNDQNLMAAFPQADVGGITPGLAVNPTWRTFVKFM